MGGLVGPNAVISVPAHMDPFTILTTRVASIEANAAFQHVGGVGVMP